MKGQTFAEMAFSPNLTPGSGSIGVTINFPASFIVSEIALVRVTMADNYGSFSPPDQNVALNAVSGGVTQIVSAGSTQKLNAQAGWWGDKISSITFGGWKNGQVSAYFRMFVNFW